MKFLKYILVPLILFFSFSCSKLENKIEDLDVNIYYEHSLISDYEVIRSDVSEMIKSEIIDIDSQLGLFRNTWVHSFKSKKNWPESLEVKIKEHQPLAELFGGSYLTHTGHIIFPRKQEIEFDIVFIDGPDRDILDLFYLSRAIQTQLNRFNSRVVSFELLNNDLLKTITDSGVVIIFSRKSFQVQLERLEDFISFELNSGKLEDIRNIDLRYKNAIAVKYI